MKTPNLLKAISPKLAPLWRRGLNQGHIGLVLRKASFQLLPRPEGMENAAREAGTIMPERQTDRVGGNRTIDKEVHAHSTPPSEIRKA